MDLVTGFGVGVAHVGATIAVLLQKLDQSSATSLRDGSRLALLLCDKRRLVSERRHRCNSRLPQSKMCTHRSTPVWTGKRMLRIRMIRQCSFVDPVIRCGGARGFSRIAGAIRTTEETTSTDWEAERALRWTVTTRW